MSASVQSSDKLVTRNVGISSRLREFIDSPRPFAPARIEGGTYLPPAALISDGEAPAGKSADAEPSAPPSSTRVKYENRQYGSLSAKCARDRE